MVFFFFFFFFFLIADFHFNNLEFEENKETHCSERKLRQKAQVWEGPKFKYSFEEGGEKGGEGGGGGGGGERDGMQIAQLISSMILALRDRFISMDGRAGFCII